MYMTERDDTMGFFFGRQRQKKTNLSSNLNKKVDKKLEKVAEIFADAAGSFWKETVGSLFYRRLLFEKRRYLSFIDMQYRYENRLFSISYNLEFSTEVSAKEGSSEYGDCFFQVQHKGKLHITDACWICKKFGGTAEEREQILEQLNHPLLIDRIIALDMMKASVSHKKGCDNWCIRFESMIGSATWMLIPPMIHLIEPRAEECIKIIEFFELVSDAVLWQQNKLQIHGKIEFM